MDMDFLAQYFVLLHANKHPEIISNSTAEVFHNLMNCNLIDKKTGKELLAANQYLNALFALLRLCGGGILDEGTAPHGLKQLINATLGNSDFETTKENLLVNLTAIRKYFAEFIG
jgi:glutamate-ammonia-ligase adenylyltransferase